MAQPTNTFATNDMVGIREDLADVIYNIAPFETVFLSSIKKVKATQPTHEWQTDTLASASDTNAVIEGDTVSVGASVPTVRLNNVTQLMDKSARVSSRARASTTAGRADELVYQMEMKKAKELRTDVEKRLLANKIKVTGDDSTAPELAGVPTWIKTNTSFNTAGSGSDPTAADGTDARNDGTQRVFEEDYLKEVIREAWDAGGTPNKIYVGSFNRQIVSGFGNGTVVQKAEDPKLHATFRLYDSDFGLLSIIPNRLQRSRDCLVLDTDLWAWAVLQDFHSFDLPKDSHSDARTIAVEGTLESRNEKGSGGVFDLTTS